MKKILTQYAVCALGECKTGMQSTSSARSEFCDGNPGCNRLEQGMVRN